MVRRIIESMSPSPAHGYSLQDLMAPWYCDVAHTLLQMFTMDTIRPALSSEEWQQRRSGGITLQRVGEGSVQLVLTEPTVGTITVRDPEQAFALMALANACLPDADPRKFAIADAAICHLLLERLAALELDPHLADMAKRLCQKVEALLPTR